MVPDQVSMGAGGARKIYFCPDNCEPSGLCALEIQKFRDKFCGGSFHLAKSTLTIRWHVPQEISDSVLISLSIFLLYCSSISQIYTFASLVSDDDGLPLFSSSSTLVCPSLNWNLIQMCISRYHAGITPEVRPWIYLWGLHLGWLKIARLLQVLALWEITLPWGRGRYHMQRQVTLSF